MLSDGNKNGKKNQEQHSSIAHFLAVVAARLQRETS